MRYVTYFRTHEFNLSKNIVKDLNPNQAIFIGNTKINSSFDNFIELNSNNKTKSKNDNKLYGHQNNNIIKQLIALNTQLNYNKKFKTSKH